MAANGSYHMAWGPGANVPGTNPSGSHYSGNFGSNQGIVTGCGGPLTSSQTAAGNPGYQYSLKGGRRTLHKMRTRKYRRKRYRGGYGYGFLEPQKVVGNYTMGIDKYANVGVNDASMLGTTKQYNPSDYPLKSIPTLKGGRHKGRRHRGGAVNYFYGYSPEGEGDQTVFMGSGYPEISKGSQCAGSKRYKRSRRNRSLTKRFNRMKTKLMKRFKRTRKQRGGYHQYLGNQAFSLTHETGGYLPAKLSALANPVPFTPTNNCTDPNGPPR